MSALRNLIRTGGMLGSLSRVRSTPFTLRFTITLSFDSDSIQHATLPEVYRNQNRMHSGFAQPRHRIRSQPSQYFDASVE